MRNGTQIDKLELHNVITKILVEVCRSTADLTGLVFNPNSDIYFETIDKLVNKYVKAVDSPHAREEVRRILPSDLPLHERKNRLNVYGLDAKSAVDVERYAQERFKKGAGPTAYKDVERVRTDAFRRRGNLIAITETNRIVNTSLEALWQDNLSGVSKADVVYIDVKYRDIAQLPKNAKKEWITRRDGRVCQFCDPLDGLTAKIGEEFDTERGMFMVPPIHPRCRCFVILGG